MRFLKWANQINKKLVDFLYTFYIIYIEFFPIIRFRDVLKLQNQKLNRLAKRLLGIFSMNDGRNYKKMCLCIYRSEMIVTVFLYIFNNCWKVVKVDWKTSFYQDFKLKSFPSRLNLDFQFFVSLLSLFSTPIFIIYACFGEMGFK